MEKDLERSLSLAVLVLAAVGCAVKEPEGKKEDLVTAMATPALTDNAFLRENDFSPTVLPTLSQRLEEQEQWESQKIKEDLLKPVPMPERIANENLLVTVPGDLVVVNRKGSFLLDSDNQVKREINAGVFSPPDQSVFPGWPYRLGLTSFFDSNNCRGVVSIPLDQSGSRQTLAVTPNRWDCVFGSPVIGPRGYGAVFVRNDKQISLMLFEPLNPHHQGIIFHFPEWFKEGRSLYFLAGKNFGKMLVTGETQKGHEAFLLSVMPRVYTEEEKISGNRGVAEAHHQLSEKMMRANLALPKELISLGEITEAFPAPHQLSPVYPYFPFNE